MPQTLSRARPFWLKSTRVSFPCKSRHLWVQHVVTKAATSHLFTPLFMFIYLPLIHFVLLPRLLIDFKNSKWLTYFCILLCILLCICYCFPHPIGLFFVTWLSLSYKFTRFFYLFSVSLWRRVNACSCACLQKNIFFLTRLERLI